MKNPKCRGVRIPFSSKLGGSSSLHCTILEVYGGSFPSSTPKIQALPHPLPGKGFAQHIFTLQTSRAQTGMEE